MEKSEILEKIQEITIDYNEDEAKLEELLKEAKALSELQNDLNNIIGIQRENINNIEKISEKVSNTTELANKELEIASGRRFKMLPIFLGTGVGVAVTLPITVGLGLSGAAVGGIVTGSSLLGGFLGKNLYK